MTCQETVERLAPYLDHELSEVEAKQVEDHVSSCAACALELARTRRLFGLIAEPLAGVAVGSPEERFAAIWSSVAADGHAALGREARVVRGEGSRRAAGGSRRARSWRGLAAAGLAAALAVGVWWVAEPGDVATDVRRMKVAKSAPQRVAGSEEATTKVAKAVATSRETNGAVAKADEASRPKTAQVASAPPDTSAPQDTGPVAQVANPAAKPPRAVRRRPGMFLDYSIVRRLDELENYEAVMAQGKADDRRS